MRLNVLSFAYGDHDGVASSSQVKKGGGGYFTTASLPAHRFLFTDRRTRNADQCQGDSAEVLLLPCHSGY